MVMSGEFDLISKYFRPLAAPEGLALLDDASCISCSPHTDVITTKDMLVENVHFRSDDPVETLGHKVLAVNVSDCISKGAKPKFYWLAIALPRDANVDWFKRLSRGLQKAQDVFGCALAGGDTTVTDGPIVISVTLMGEVPHGQMIKRSGAKLNDDVYVTGTIGDAALGLWCLENSHIELHSLISAYQKPIPPYQFGPVGRALINSSADISDGLIADAVHVAEASSVGMRLRQNKIPISDQAKELLQIESELWPQVWSGGDDYQMVFTAPKGQRDKIAILAQQTKTKLTIIGETCEAQGVQLLDPEGEIVQVPIGGYTHF